MLVAALFFLSMAVDDKVDIQIDNANRSVERELTTLVQNARSQSSAFASTSFIGYSVGRYYGFASAFQQISPDPERAAALLRSTYPPGDTPPAEIPAALTAYAAVHDRFHASFRDLLASTVFDDLYLIDRFGRVVYSLRKDAAFGADLAAARQRESALGTLFREVMGRLPQAQTPEQVMVLTQPLPLDQGHGMLLGRPVVRHGTVEGVVVFRVPIGKVQERLARLTQDGIGFALLDGAGNMVTSAPGGEKLKGWARQEPRVLEDGGWRYVVLSDGAKLAGGLNYIRWLLLLAGFGAITLFMKAFREPPPATDAGGFVPVGPSAPLDVAPPVSVPVTPADRPEPPPAPVAAPVAEEPEHHDHADEGDHAAALDADEGYRRCLVDVMTLALDYWQKAKRKGKIELAEESGLWRVYMDRSSLQTRTLDKYLLVETLPRNPRWRDVVRTAEYVLRHCGEPQGERETLSVALGRLKQHLKQAERV
ncbi:hypothetical protein C0V82_08930 [Niveispirillum cyanobacteriorum]|uniref:Uncharacterized protein n=1 Tax=Niveispirillum cyanobacteriorum TaxID=1612173 RepID=A0A2K9NB12_9PROT|nr:hypothetical protein C0V82_08930 [Niveispirillum cyanobacteriorum]GGE55521.1 hypothetical protein GCM10011317_12070 [Niveispirillum cyanobacteriorum]